MTSNSDLKIRVLILSLDRALIDKSGEGDTFKRFTAYRKSCESLSAIVPTHQRASVLAKNGVKVIPAYGKSNLSAYWRMFWLAKETLSREKVNLIVTNDAVLGAMALWLRCDRKVKVQINIFGLEIVNSHWLRERPQNIILKWIQEWAIKRTDGLRTDNPEDKKLLVAHYAVPSERIVVIPVAPSLEEQRAFLSTKENKRYKEGLVGNKKMILAVGGLIEAKDYPTLIKAMKGIKPQQSDAILVIVGEGSERNVVESLISRYQLGDSIKLLGSVPYQDMPAIFAVADVFVLCSTHEGLPRSLMEAALSGKPIVGTKVGGIMNLIKNGQSGLIVPVRDARALAEAIKKMLKNRQRAEAWGKRAQAKAKQFLDFNRGVKKLIQSWQKLLYENEG